MAKKAAASSDRKPRKLPKPAAASAKRPARKRGAAESAQTLNARDFKRNSKEELSDDPSNMRFTDTHEWVRVKDNKTIVVGLADFAQIRLSDITTVELPEPDDHHYDAKEEISVIEALNSSTAFHAPVGGTIAATNTELLSRPELINLDPYGRGWLVEMRPDNMTDIFDLMDADQYEAHLPEDEEE